jgi:hypothetical protein
MASVRILDGEVPVEFLKGRDGADLDETALLEGLEATVRKINETDWSDEERRAFGLMRKIVFFEGEVVVNGWPLTRPGCDEDDAIFYWEANEFMANTDADVRANTFFHDCWHVVQFQATGDFARGEAERVNREIDAIDRQIAVATKLGCDEREIQFLRDFRANQDRIVARLAEGVGTRMRHNPETGRA